MFEHHGQRAGSAKRRGDGHDDEQLNEGTHSAESPESALSGNDSAVIKP